jgi:putative tryptophan/tyrosine transport system substrate-binding protein
LRRFSRNDGRNARIDIRWGAGDAERYRTYAAELVALAPDVVLAAAGSTIPALLQATRAVPIVFAQTPDPVGAGFVESLARPGGNVTGFTTFEYGMSGKYLELLKEIAPRVTRAAVLRDAADPAGIGQWAAIQSMAPSLGVEVTLVGLRDAGEIYRAITAFPRGSNGGLIVTGSYGPSLRNIRGGIRPFTSMWQPTVGSSTSCAKDSTAPSGAATRPRRSRQGVQER